MTTLTAPGPHSNGTSPGVRRLTVMLDHTGFVVSDLARARRFYDAIAKALGLGTTDNGLRRSC